MSDAAAHRICDVYDGFVDLDPAHPTLDDHRPGGLPLFGTAMSVQALVDCASGVIGRKATRIDDVEVHHPWIHKDGVPLRLGVRLEDSRRGSVRKTAASLWSPSAVCAEMLHLKCRLTFVTGSSTLAKPLQAAGQVRWPAKGVSAKDIYSVYFHGPAFQVLGGACLIGEGVVSRLSATLANARIPVTARLLEFGLQTAGLLELAFSGRMMIPHTIGRITPAVPVLDDVTGPVFARARFGGAGRAGPQIDIDVVTQAGAVVMTIRAYRTVALPFASDAAGAAQLAGRLREKSLP